VSIYVTNPLSDTRWNEFVARHPRASVFHQRGWLEALARTYGYEPLVLTTAPAGEPLRDGIVFSRVSSWITGTRLVSLPFADHCEPLLNDCGEFVEFGNWLQAECNGQRWKYVELRPLLPVQAAYGGWQQSGSYAFHDLDLRPSLEQLFRGLHRNSIQRKILRAERERLCYETGRSEQLVDEFYRLLLITRRRHLALPQPRAWFRNLFQYIGDGIEIRLARKNGNPVAAMLTLRHRSSVVYKYGCSDRRFHNLGGMPFLFWRLIEECKASGTEEIDFGRSDLDNPSLSVFKERFGTTRKSLTYYRYQNTERPRPEISLDSQVLRRFVCMLPDTVFSTAGRLVYRHLG
jgi:hypothetical protein